MRFFSAGDHALKSVGLGELTAIYDRRSGQTHVISAPVPELLAALIRPRNLGELVEALELDGDATTRSVLIERLDELLASGLIEQA